MIETWLLLGAGRCGLQLARAMRAAGLELAGVVAHSARSRRRARRALPDVALVPARGRLPRCGGVVVAVPDPAIADCAAALAPRLAPATRVALHTSGLMPASALAALAGAGCRIGSLHPLASFPSATGPAVPLGGVLAAVEGDAAAVREARALARRLGMRPVAVAAETKPLYHAAAALAANLTHVLAVTAVTQLERAGLERRTAAAGLRALIDGSVDAALAARGMEHLTGPLARGDVAAVRAHLAALPSDVASAYRAVARLALGALAAERILADAAVRTLRTALTG